MTTFSVNDDGPTTINGSGSDTLVYVANHENGIDTSLNGSAATGYAGFIDGPGGGNCTFGGILNFSITDNGVNGTADHINTGDGSDTIHAGRGDDILYSGGGAGIDRINGGAGDDIWGADTSAYSTAIVIDLSAGVAQTYLGTGLVQNIEGFNLTTGSGADVLTGTTAPLSDFINSGAGKDRIVLPMDGSDTIDGGAGNDTLVLAHSFDNGVDMTASIDAGGGYDGVFDGALSNNTSFSHIEAFSFTDTGNGADDIATGSGDDTLSGGAGDDVLNSGAGKDVIDGGSGVDTWIADRSTVSSAITVDLSITGVQQITGGGSIKSIEGLGLTTGAGADVVVVSSAAANDTIDTGAGKDQITEALAGTDSVDGGADRDRLVLDCGATEADFSATASADGYSGVFDGPGATNLSFAHIEDFSITFDGRANAVSGLTGNDYLNGAAGNDSIDGGAGIDTIVGGLGADQLASGAGADVFVYQSVRESFGQNADLITDLTNVDTIDLSAIDADTTQAGDQAFHLVDHFSGAAGEAVLKYDKVADVTSLSLDDDGDGKADAIIQMSGNHKTFDHFVL